MDYWLSKECVQDGYAFLKQWNDFIERRKEKNNYVDANPNTTPLPSIIGAIIVNPVTNSLVSTSSKERKNQIQELDKTLGNDENNNNKNNNCKSLLFPEIINPLCTSIILALQGVCRNERYSAMNHGMNSHTFKKGQVCFVYTKYCISPALKTKMMYAY